MTKETIQEYLEEVNTKIWPNSKSMQEYCRKKCSDVFKSTGGYLVEFEKPAIETRFCFGHGMYGVTTREDENRAFDAAENARTNESYFLKQNLRQFDEWLETLNGTDKLYLMHNYQKTSKIACVKSETYFWHYQWDREKIVEELSQSDIEKLKQVIISEKEKFKKRLNTYLKRYGLSKIHSWTYLVD